MCIWCFFLACLGSLVWSANSKRLAYVAESKKLSKEKCLLTSKPPKPEETSLNAANKDVTTTSVAAAADAIDENNFEDVWCFFLSLSLSLSHDKII